MKDMQGFYSTTSKRAQIFEATQQANSVNENPGVGGPYMETGFTQNHKAAPFQTQPWMNDMRAGNDVFSKPKLTSDLIGARADERAIAGAMIRTSTRRADDPLSNYGRQHAYPPVPTSGVPGAASVEGATIGTNPTQIFARLTGAGSRPTSRQQTQNLSTTVSKIHSYDAPPNPKSYGAGVVF